MSTPVEPRTASMTYRITSTRKSFERLQRLDQTVHGKDPDVEVKGWWNTLTSFWSQLVIIKKSLWFLGRILYSFVSTHNSYMQATFLSSGLLLLFNFVAMSMCLSHLSFQTWTGIVYPILTYTLSMTLLTHILPFVEYILTFVLEPWFLFSAYVRMRPSQTQSVTTSSTFDDFLQQLAPFDKGTPTWGERLFLLMKLGGLQYYSLTQKTFLFYIQGHWQFFCSTFLPLRMIRAFGTYVRSFVRPDQSHKNLPKPTESTYTASVDQLMISNVDVLRNVRITLFGKEDALFQVLRSELQRLAQQQPDLSTAEKDHRAMQKIVSTFGIWKISLYLFCWKVMAQKWMNDVVSAQGCLLRPPRDPRPTLWMFTHCRTQACLFLSPTWAQPLVLKEKVVSLENPYFHQQYDLGVLLRLTNWVYCHELENRTPVSRDVLHKHLVSLLDLRV